MSDPTQMPPASGTDQQLLARVRAVGESLQGRFQVLHADLGAPHLGPGKLAQRLGQAVPTASRLLKAIGQAQLEAVVYHIPGPDPLRRWVRAAARRGADSTHVRAAREAVDDFEQLIREEAGDRSTLEAMLQTFVPEARRAVELRRRQAAFRALSELRGVSCDVDMVTMILHPSNDGQDLDVVLLLGRFGLRRLRPDALVKFESRMLNREQERPVPTSLNGESTVDSLDAARLDGFCDGPPSPIEAVRTGDTMHYLLGPTGIGPRSCSDVLLGEVNRAAMPRSVPAGGRRQFVYHLASMPARRLLFELYLHRDIYTEGEVELRLYDSSSGGPADVNDPGREFDRLPANEELQRLGTSAAQRRFNGQPRHAELIEHAASKLGWDASALRGYRLVVDHPMLGMQACMVLPHGPGSG